jgi:hypothetical protein
MAPLANAFFLGLASAIYSFLKEKYNFRMFQKKACRNAPKHNNA